MWNRVILLASGMAFGWSLVNAWTVAPAEVRRQQLRLAISLLVGLGMIIWIGASDWRAGLLAALVFAVSALVAYAGNAKQVSRVEPPLPPRQPERPLGSRTPVLVLLVSSEGPAGYAGPLVWAARLRERAARGLKVPHWFRRPRAYARIRAAWQGAAAAGASDAALAADVAQSLPAGCALRLVYRYAAPSLVAALVDAPAEGYARVLLVPLEPVSEGEDWLRREVQRAGVLEVGVIVRYASPPLPLWPQALLDAQLEALMKGQQQPLPSAEASARQALSDRISALCAAW